MEEEKLKDIRSQCCDCPKEFIFTAGEQKFFKEKDLKPPKRCYDCRQKRKRELHGEEA